MGWCTLQSIRCLSRSLYYCPWMAATAVGGSTVPYLFFVTNRDCCHDYELRIPWIVLSRLQWVRDRRNYSQLKILIWNVKNMFRQVFPRGRGWTSGGSIASISLPLAITLYPRCSSVGSEWECDQLCMSCGLQYVRFCAILTQNQNRKKVH